MDSNTNLYLIVVFSLYLVSIVFDTIKYINK